MSWRVKEPCVDCPFNNSGAGAHLRKSLGVRRWQQITSDLLHDGNFYCHKTTGEEDDFGNVDTRGALICAGALAWQDSHNVSSQYARICERLNYFAAKRASK
jgi:hypothetical protein